MTRGSRAAFILAAAALVALLACAGLFATKIADIKGDPGKYENKVVTVSGTVDESHNLILVRYYTVNDGSGTISVVTKDALPKEGAKVTVKGTVNQAFKLGDASVLVLIEEPRS